MELLEKLELIEVSFEDKKAVLTFLDESRGEVREVNFNKQVYDDGKFIDNEEKAEQVETWCEEYFNVSFDDLQKAVGDRKDIYAYDNFNSLWESEVVSKFDEDMIGQIFETEIKDIKVDQTAIKIRFDYDGKTYETKMGFAKYHETLKKWFVDPLKKKKQFEKFETKFHVPVEQATDLIGKTIMIEVKKAMGKYIYCEAKPFPKKKS